MMVVRNLLHLVVRRLPEEIPVKVLLKDAISALTP